MTAARIEHLVTSGTFSLDGGTWEVDKNVWIVGDDEEVVVVDAAHDADAIAAVVGDRRLGAIVCTHGHDDHIDAAPALADATGAPVLIHLDYSLDDLGAEVARAVRALPAQAGQGGQEQPQGRCH